MCLRIAGIHVSALTLAEALSPGEQFRPCHGQVSVAPQVITSGVVIEYLPGAMKSPPQWMGHVGLEWLYRLSENSKQLAHRYLLKTLLPLFLRDLWHCHVGGCRT